MPSSPIRRRQRCPTPANGVSFVRPNDAFLAANTHREGTSLFDILQPAYAALYSGAIHPTAEAHAIVADHVIRHVRAILDKRDAKQAFTGSSAR